MSPPTEIVPDDRYRNGETDKRSCGLAIATALNDWCGYDVEDDDGWIVEQICVTAGIRPEWQVRFNAMTARWDTSASPRRDRWRSAWFENQPEKRGSR